MVVALNCHPPIYPPHHPPTNCDRITRHRTPTHLLVQEGGLAGCRRPCQQLERFCHNQPRHNGIGGGDGVDDVASHALREQRRRRGPQGREARQGGAQGQPVGSNCKPRCGAGSLPARLATLPSPTSHPHAPGAALACLGLEQALHGDAVAGCAQVGSRSHKLHGERVILVKLQAGRAGRAGKQGK